MKWLLPFLVVATAHAQDGQSYPVRGGALGHAAMKAAASGLTYAGLRKLGVGKPVAALAASVGVWGAAKGVELLKGHKLGPIDTVHDLGWHTLGVLPAFGKRWTIGLVGGGLAVGLFLTRCKAAPRWGC